MPWERNSSLWLSAASPMKWGSDSRTLPQRMCMGPGGVPDISLPSPPPPVARPDSLSLLSDLLSNPPQWLGSCSSFLPFLGTINTLFLFHSQSSGEVLPSSG